MSEWQPIETAPPGSVTEDAGCRGNSVWFLAKTNQKKYKFAAPMIVIHRRAWPHEDSWSCGGDADYAPDYFTHWMNLPEPPQ